MSSKYENEGLYQRHRPKSFDDLIGQGAAVAVLKGLLRKSPTAFPPALLLSGLSGSGKTTAALILKGALGCADGDWIQTNSAKDRGIDFVRSLERGTRLAPSGGHVRICLLDECFPAGTLVKTPAGAVPIEDIKPGDTVLNIEGPVRVKRTFRNHVEPHRAVRVHLSNGRSIITTESHEFLTTEGWVPAGRLEGSWIFGVAGDRMGKPTHLTENRRADAVRLSSLSEDVHSEGQGEAEDGHSCVQQVVRFAPESRSCGAKGTSPVAVRLLRGADHTQTERESQVLREVLSCEGQADQAGDSCDSVQQRVPRETEQIADGTQRQREGPRAAVQAIGCDDRYPSVPGSDREDQGDETPEGHAERLAGASRRERSVHAAAAEAVRRTHGPVAVLGARAGHTDPTQVAVASQVPAGHRPLRPEDLRRGRWERAPAEKSYRDRCQEDGMSELARVVRVEVYQQGCGWEAGLGDVCDRGGVRAAIFYDLEIDGHPSYFADGIPVHNCHKLSGDAQEALLERLESVPKTFKWFLCTTEPEKLKKAVRTRLVEAAFVPVSEKDLSSLVSSVARKEGVKLKPATAAAIAERAQGSPRQALTLLEAVINLDDQAQIDAALDAAEEASPGKSLAQLLFDQRGCSWPDIAAAIKLVTEAESARRGVLGYADAVALKNPAGSASWTRAMLVLTHFQYNTYDTGRVGLTLAAGKVLQALAAHAGQKKTG